ncbi:MAG: 16S rRNA (guanine(527)-N(7))-methyltransferase RsmG [Burkholderiaceae bacterium]
MTDPFRDSLDAGARALGLALKPAQLDQLLVYAGLLEKWAKVYNLTALRGRQEMLTHHLFDSLALVVPLRRHLQTLNGATRVLDVGAGAGLPGVVVAICCPEVAVTSVDAVAKKAAFITQVALTLRLKNLVGQHARVEALDDKFDVITSRAFASLADFTAWSSDALSNGGVWVAMKGKRPDEEMASLPSSLTVFHVERLQVPGLGAERCLVWISRSA